MCDRQCHSVSQYIFHVVIVNLRTAVGASFFGDMLQPQGTSQAGVNGAGGGGAQGAGGAKGKLVSGDLDASLANLTTNLNLTSGANKYVFASNNMK